jgi:hypothetical protein
MAGKEPPRRAEREPLYKMRNRPAVCLFFKKNKSFPHEMGLKLFPCALPP